MTDNSLISKFVMTLLILFILITTLRVKKQISKTIYNTLNPSSPYYRAVYKNKKKK